MPLIETRIVHGPHYFTKKRTFAEEEQTDKKAERAEDLYSQRVTVGLHEYDAGERSMDRIDRVLTLANAKMNGAIAQGLTFQQAWQAVYVDTAVPWKMADNSIQIVNAQTLMQVQDAAMEGMKQIWLKYG